MRMFKFRVWDGKKMIPWLNFLENGLREYDSLGNILDGGLDKYIVMQWTGLLDNNGKEIYERDIIEYGDVRCKYCNNLLHNSHELYIVEWDDINCCFEAVNDKIYITPSVWEDKVIVVGNIYENIELIRQAK